jgi:pyruvate/2-oxoglutarate dehydrogenase complex dihydrolipoamide dehydrogenase (E3) component
MAEHYDFLVIGGGSAGFNAARVAREHSERVAIVDGAEKLGGLCILRGCMPSKTLIYSAEVLHLARHGKLFGLQIDGARADMKAVHERKLRIIGEFADHREKVLTSGRFAIHRAMARFRDAHTVELSNGETLTADRIMIGTGSKVAWPGIPGLAESGAWTSDDVLELDFLPESVLVLGGGIVACELAQFLARMGSRVIQIQRSSRILRDFSESAAMVIEKVFRAEGIELFTGTHLRAVRGSTGSYEVSFEHEGRTTTVKAAHLLNALGRVPDTGSLNLPAAGVDLLEDGRIAITEWQQTSKPHIYAGGDCTGPHEIVHIAVAQGELAARHSFGVHGIKPIDYGAMVHVVFTDPQVAVAGRGSVTLTGEGVPHLVADYPFDDHGRSILMEAKHGFVRVVAAPGDGRVLGAEIVGKDGGELIHAFSVGITMRATVHDMLRAQWYHPTLAEIVTYPLEEIAERISPSAKS